MEPSRWELIRVVLVFQLKVVTDGLRDLLLGPASLVAAILSRLGVVSRRGSLFFEGLRLGRRSERWINLFGAVDRLEASPGSSLIKKTSSVDDLVRRVEKLLLEEVERGGVTASAKQAIDRALDAVQVRKAG